MALLGLARLELEQEEEGEQMNQNADVEESGKVSRRDGIPRDGRCMASPARRRSRYGRRGVTVPSTGEHSERFLTKIDSRLTARNSKFDMETWNLAKIEVVEG